MKKTSITLLVLAIGVVIGIIANNHFLSPTTADNLQLDEQEATVRAIQTAMPAVVNIVVYDYIQTISIDLTTGDQTMERERKEQGSGTGFLISSDGLIVTNKHVINNGNDETAEYRIIFNDGKKYYAQLIGRDPFKDLAVLKIFDKDLPYLELGDSDNLPIGSSVIAIGNALGRYQNSATKGIISGKGRNLEASDQNGNGAVFLDNLLQTDAEINVGNSGGPLINLEGKVIGVNTALDQSGSSVGFAIPVNDVRRVVKSVRESGRIIRPRLGVRYIIVTPDIAEESNLSRDNGALILAGGEGGPAVFPDSPAEKGGLLEGDIIFEINAIKINEHNTLFSIVQKYDVGDKIGMKIQRGNKVIIRVVELDEFK
ncbi:MAG: trypsin-like peptidase domain-containing protein [Candidatus Falkowbacteria bacterium]